MLHPNERLGHLKYTKETIRTAYQVERQRQKGGLELQSEGLLKQLESYEKVIYAL